MAASNRLVKLAAPAIIENKRKDSDRPAADADGRKAPDGTAGDLTAGLDPRYTFANFVVGKPNELAFAVARRTAESERVSFNLFLYGGVGLGKTHLMHAIAGRFGSSRPGAR